MADENNFYERINKLKGTFLKPQNQPQDYTQNQGQLPPIPMPNPTNMPSFPINQGAQPPQSPQPPNIAKMSPTIGQPTENQGFLDRLNTSWNDGSLNKAFENPLNQGLLTAGLSMMATPPRAQPYSDLEVLGKGALAGVGAANEANTRQVSQEQKDLRLMMAMKKEQDLNDYRKTKLAQGGGGGTPTQYKDFRAGFQEEYKKKHPNATPAEIAGATAKEAKRLGVEEKINVGLTVATGKAKAFADERYYSMFDTETGKATKVKGYQLNKDGGAGKYLDLADPNIKADSQSLAKVTKGMDSIDAFEKGATRALDYSRAVAKDFGLGKYPKANKIKQIFQYHMGDPKVKGLKNSIVTAATEYMKVINAGSDLTAAELSVKGQERANEIIEASDNFESLSHSMDIMKKEMEISGQKFKDEHSIVANRLKSYGKGTAQPSAPAQKVGRFTIEVTQ